jgi:hypothetical protein
MKEILSSLRFVAIDRVQPSNKWRSRNILGIILLPAVLFISTNVVSAQSAEPGQASISTVLADPVRSEWKSHTEYSAVITAVKIITTTKLDDVTLQGPDKILYTALDRLLSYIQSDLENHDEVAPLADKNYKRIISESNSDPALQNLPMADFTALYNELVVKLRH